MHLALPCPSFQGHRGIAPAVAIASPAVVAATPQEASERTAPLSEALATGTQLSPTPSAAAVVGDDDTPPPLTVRSAAGDCPASDGDSSYSGDAGGCRVGAGGVSSDLLAIDWLGITSYMTSAQMPQCTAVHKDTIWVLSIAYIY